ncbi:MAG: hypothetical protein ACHQT6_00145 [Candidatus Acidiferrales bacterium]
MRKPSSKLARGRGQQGYALLIVMFLLTLLVLMTITVAPNVLTDARREKETEMVWRGKQYVRGIKRYYMKTHRFPVELNDLAKPKTGIRFMRQAYKDPMNDVDGSWRLIYVGPNGQLIGSLKNRNTTGPGVPVSSMAAASSSSSFGNSSFGGSSSSFGNSSFGGSSSSFGNSSSSFGNSPFGRSSFSSGNSSNSMMGSSGFGNNATNFSGQPNASGDNQGGTDAALGQETAGPVETPVIMGGNIIGVGSKINKKSFMWYDKAKNYREFEFIWDPSKDTAAGVGAPGQLGPGLGTPIGGPNGLSPVSSGFGQNQNQNTSPTSPNQQPSNPPEGGPPLQAPPPNQN